MSVKPSFRYTAAFEISTHASSEKEAGKNLKGDIHAISLFCEVFKCSFEKDVFKSGHTVDFMGHGVIGYNIVITRICDPGEIRLVGGALAAFMYFNGFPKPKEELELFN